MNHVVADAAELAELVGPLVDGAEALGDDRHEVDSLERQERAPDGEPDARQGHQQAEKCINRENGVLRGDDAVAFVGLASAIAGSRRDIEAEDAGRRKDHVGDRRAVFAQRKLVLGVRVAIKSI